jgi:DNA/RNA endonuclease YhcR with UshA esterase domain
MEEKKQNVCAPPGAIREFPAETLCPSCGKFVGAYEKCPYCGTEIKKRMSIVFFKRAALVLAIGGLFLLWLTATRMQPPLIHISEITPRYNNAVVEVKGKVVNTRMGKKDDITFFVDDGTDELKVQAFRGRKVMKDSGNLPRVGDMVSVVGTIQLTEKFGTSLMINIPSKVKVIPATPEKVTIGEITVEDKNKIVKVTGEIVSVRTFKGHRFLLIGDATGLIEVPLFKSDLEKVKDTERISTVGKEISVVGNVGEYHGKPQIMVRDIEAIEVLAEDTIPTKNIPGYEEAQRKAKALEEKMSPAMRTAEQQAEEQGIQTY